jgi:predicted ATP-dependent protease
MLDPEVVAAVGRGEFEVHVVSRVEEALALLTGLPAAEVVERVRLRLSRFRKIAGLRN